MQRDNIQEVLKSKDHRETMEELFRLLIQDGQATADDLPELRSKYKDPQTFQIYNLRNQLYRAGALDEELTSHITLVVRQTGGFDAEAVRRKSGENEIGVSFGLIAFLAFLIHSLQALATSQDAHPFDNSLTTDEWARSIAGIACYIKHFPNATLKSTPVMTKGITVDKDNTWHTELILMFCLAHEYGHHLLGHLDGSRTISPHDAEFESDNFGFSALKTFMGKSSDEVLWVVAPFFFFDDLADGMDNRRPSQTHPSGLDRLQRLIDQEKCDPLKLMPMINAFRYIKGKGATIVEIEKLPDGTQLRSIVYETEIIT